MRSNDYNDTTYTSSNAFKRGFLNGNVFEDFHRLHPDIQILLLSKFEDVYTSKDQFVEEIAFYVPLCVSIVTASSPVQL